MSQRLVSQVALAILLGGLVGCGHKPVIVKQTLPPFEQVLSSVQQQAKVDHKHLLLTFGASWCGDCTRLHAFLASKEIKAVLDKYFVYGNLSISEAKSETSRFTDNAGALDWLQSHGIPANLPTIVILDQNLKVLSDSAHPSKKKSLPNLGAPPFDFTQLEIFLRMVSEGGSNVSLDDLKTLRRLLEGQIEASGTTQSKT